MGDVTEVVREQRRYDAGEDAPISRLDNDDGFGSHDIHLGDEEYHFDFPGLVPVYEAFVAALPPEKRSDVSDSI